MLKKYSSVLVLVLAASGCANLSQQGSVPINPPATRSAQSCGQFFQQAEQLVTGAQVRDAAAARMVGFPYLRVNRFLASFHAQHLEGAEFSAWLDRLQELASEGWRVEFSNLAAAERTALRRFIPPGSSGELLATVESCGTLLRAADVLNREQAARLRAAAQVPDAYQNWQRAVGLYPLTALAFAAGIKHWQADTRKVYAQELAALPQRGQLLHFAPPAAARLSVSEIAALLAHSAQNALHIPQPNPSERALLFDSFAPTFDIDIVSNDDRPGAPVWNSVHATSPQVDTRQPVVYRYLSHTRFAGQILLQLNYIVWFPARPRRSVLDTLGGVLDGLTWRVTLTADGRPWIYDAMHNCGCYQEFFPTRRAALRMPPAGIAETAFIPQTAPEAGPPGISLRIAPGAHYLQRLTASAASTTTGSTSPALTRTASATAVITYQWREYATLRSLPVSSRDERRSLFGADGIVPGTERLERYFFWPMGIASAGAMRQLGTHATAFVGRRHFDDPYLLANYFDLLP